MRDTRRGRVSEDHRSRDGLAALNAVLTRENDYRDGLIVELANSEAALREQNADLRRDLHAYTLMTRQLLAILNLAIVEPDNWPRRVDRIRDEHRRFAREAIAALFAEEHQQEQSAA